MLMMLLRSVIRSYCNAPRIKRQFLPQLQQCTKQPSRTIIISSRLNDDKTATTATATAAITTTRTTTRISNDKNNPLVAATRKWFETIVIGMKLCPFAPPLVDDKTATTTTTTLDKDALRIVSCHAQTIEDAVRDVVEEVSLLMDDNNTQHQDHHETTLVVFELQELQNDFLSHIRFSWQLQKKAVIDLGYENDLQLVLFHPMATHNTYAENADDDNPSADDYTIRSPFPTVHLLRESDVMRAVQSGYPNLEQLPTRNKAKLRELGTAKCKAKLNECYVS